MASIEPIDAFRLIALEFNTVPDNTVLSYIDFVKPLVSKRKFGDLYERAIALLAAHYMKINGIQGSGGGSTVQGAPSSFGVASYTEGSTSISFNTQAPTSQSIDDVYEQTVYGSQYLSLRIMIPSITCGGETYGS